MNVLKSKQEQITLLYGKQKLNGLPYNHIGLDLVKYKSQLDYIVSPTIAKVIEARDGVNSRTFGAGYGNTVLLQHRDGVTTRYAHMKKGSIKVKVGQIVQAGQEIGYMGDSGYAFGAHLHLEVRINNICVDPLPYIQGKKTINDYIVAAQPIEKKWYASYKTQNPKGTNVRKYSGVGLINGSTVLKVYPNGTVFDIYEEKAGWGHSPSGWVYLPYCKKV